MVRLSRAETQERNRAKVLAAARDEFAEQGFRDAKIDVIAERAELTRGAVYSNFPGKRALYFAVLAELAEHSAGAPHAVPGETLQDALGALARARMAAFPLGEDQAGLARDLMPEVLADERIRRPFAQLVKLNGLLLGLALERLDPPERPEGAPVPRRVRLAETVLTVLHGAGQLAAADPGLVEPFDVVSAGERLAGLAFNDWWAPPVIAPAAQATDRPWSPPGAVDLVRAEPFVPADGVVVVLGTHRISAAEEAVRAHDGDVTVAVVTSEPDELVPLTRLIVAELCGGLRQAFPERAWPGVRVVCDVTGTLAASAGVLAVSDETEAAVRVEQGRIVATADGRGAGQAVSTTGEVSRVDDRR
ncbi:TetR/AcrR family transcriptional regulator [Amycolatopsis sp. BJA-103]|uniref:TetR/AcrR family transcriptional regulator n=1 Tax=Amycolatopsis sp. BJA-103 TaxID=1911175 RepID=UPI000C77E623|nr:TetR/AcrR family transcriptional regulator [Amycolatopsis sp. BJA-103]AUI58128.1 TetR family transcriptional regulator [Amycolatopsis sp. BJA-103]PNE15586.1 TetR family transcriptional regulator [Amycolatopsis sp. BJA-103]